MIRKLALATCAAIVASLPVPMWTATQAALAFSSRHPAVQWTAVVLAYLFAAILPLFYFALWRNGGAPRISTPLRVLCTAGALLGVVVVADGLPVTAFKTVLSDLATLSCVALLVAFARGDKSVTQISRFLRSVTLIALIGGGLWFAINLTSLLFRTTGGVQTLMEQACLFTAPFVIFISSRLD